MRTNAKHLRLNTSTWTQQNILRDTSLLLTCALRISLNLKQPGKNQLQSIMLKPFSKFRHHHTCLKTQWIKVWNTPRKSVSHFFFMLMLSRWNTDEIQCWTPFLLDSEIFMVCIPGKVRCDSFAERIMVRCNSSSELLILFDLPVSRALCEWFILSNWPKS